MFVTNYIGLLTFGLVFNHVNANLVTKSSEDENSEWKFLEKVKNLLHCRTFIRTFCKIWFASFCMELFLWPGNFS